jgi:cobalt/nickel transport system permease protein
MHIHALDAYRSKASLVHRLDARVKFILTAVYIIAVALTPEGVWLAYIALAALALVVAAASRLGLGFVYRRSVVALPFALAAITVVLSTPGQPLAAMRVFQRDLAITDTGLVRFFSIVLKSWLSVQMAVILTASTPFPSLLGAMRSLRVPKVLVAIIGFAYRYIFVIADEVMRMMRARAARSGVREFRSKGGGSVLWRARVTGGMAGNLFLRSIARSERIYDAMVARGYDGDVRVLRPPSIRPGDIGIGLVFAVLVAAIQILARWTG